METKANEKSVVLAELEKHGIVKGAKFRVVNTFRSGEFDVFKDTEMEITKVDANTVDFYWINREGWADGNHSAYPNSFIDFVTTGKVVKIN